MSDDLDASTVSESPETFYVWQYVDETGTRAGIIGSVVGPLVMKNKGLALAYEYEVKNSLRKIKYRGHAELCEFRRHKLVKRVK